MAAPADVSAQLTAAKDGPVVYGHHHVNTTNIAAQKKFFVDTLGGLRSRSGRTTEIVKFPNVLIFFRQVQDAPGGTRGTTVNHIGFSVPNLRATIDKVKASGYQMITSTEATPDRQVKDDIAYRRQARRHVDRVRAGAGRHQVELVGVPNQTTPIALHHVHFFSPANSEMQAWYVKTFGATSPARRSVSCRVAAGGRAEFLVLAGSCRRHPGQGRRPHRIRGEEPRGIHQNAGGQRRQTIGAVPHRAGAGHRHRIFHQSVGHLH